MNMQENIRKLVLILVSLAIFGLVSLPLACAESENYSLVTQWSFSGDHLSSLSGVTTDSSGNVYAIESNNHQIEKLDKNSGAVIAQFNDTTLGTNVYYSPEAASIDSSGNIYVASVDVYKLDSSGKIITKWESGFGPCAISSDQANNVYVVNWDCTVQKFDSNGKFISQWNTSETGNILCATFDPSNNVYVADSIYIYKYDINGNFISKFKGNNVGTNAIMSIATDPSGNVYIAYSTFIQKFDSNGDYITQWGTEGTYSGQFSRIEGIAVDPSGDVYVADPGNRRIEKYSTTAAPIVVVPPVASFTTNVTDGSAPLSVQFTDTSQDAEKWSWDFDDNYQTSNEKNPVHTYTSVGTYNVKLTVSNAKGSNESITTIYVQQQTNSNTDNNQTTPNNQVTPQSSTNSNTVQTPQNTSTEAVTEQSSGAVTNQSGTVTEQSPAFDILICIMAILLVVLVSKKKNN